MGIIKRYYVGITGTDSSKGYIYLTEEEAEIVKKATDSSNWETDELANINPWSRKFFIIEDKK